MVIQSLTREIDNTRSPVRQFLNRFTVGLKDVQGRYRRDAPSLSVAPVGRGEANPATLGTAADWLLRFLAHPSPNLHIPMVGAAYFVGLKLLVPLSDMAQLLGVGPECWLPHIKAWRSDQFDPLDPVWENHWAEMEGQLPSGASVKAAFTGPVPGSTIDSDLLNRGCWALALATELFRAGEAALNGPLGRLSYPARPSDLLKLAPPAAIRQLTDIRAVFETALLPKLVARRGTWALGPTFTGSQLIPADADLVAAGLLLELKVYKDLSLHLTDVLEMVGYALLDFDDEYRIDTLGLFSARFAKLATWPLGDLLNELAGHTVDVASVRDDFRGVLTRLQGPSLP